MVLMAFVLNGDEYSKYLSIFVEMRDKNMKAFKGIFFFAHSDTDHVILPIAPEVTEARGAIFELPSARSMRIGILSRQVIIK